MIGPPNVPPNWFRLIWSRPLSFVGWPFGSVKGAKKPLALKTALRTNSNTSPWNLLVPDLVMTFTAAPAFWPYSRSEEHTSELQSQSNLVCRLLLEKKKHAS